jgi:hypothetical protein
MDLTKTKEKIISAIQSSDDEVLLVELLDVVEQYNVMTSLSDEQLKVLKERILKEESGKGVYRDAREVIEQIKAGLKNV